jgi:hypothetical protein
MRDEKVLLLFISRRSYLKIHKMFYIFAVNFFKKGCFQSFKGAFGQQFLLICSFLDPMFLSGLSHEIVFFSTEKEPLR